MLINASGLLRTFTLCAWSLTTPIEAQRFIEVTGEIDMVTYRIAEGTNHSSGTPRTFSFSCVFSTNEWRIENTFLLNATSRVSFDGTNVYQSDLITSPMPADVKSRLSMAGINDAAYERARSNLTVGVFTSANGCSLANLGANIPWLAFCSSRYLKRPGRVIPLPTAQIHYASDAFAYRDTTELFPDDLGLPSQVELFTSKALYERSVTNEQFFGNHDPHIWQPLIAKTRDGLLKFQYSATSSTNISGWNVPLTFEFAENARNSTGAWVRGASGSGRVTGVREAFAPRSAFDPAFKQTVVDWRFWSPAKNVRAVTYQTTNNFALPTNDPALQARFAERVKRAPLPRYTLERRARMIVVLLFIGAAVPMAVVILKELKGKRL